jgi:hypothetical protein
MNYTCAAALSCGIGISGVVIHEFIKPLHQQEVTGVVLPRQIPLSDHDHRDTQQGPPPRRLSTITATGTATGTLPSSSVLSVGWQAFIFRPRFFPPVPKRFSRWANPSSCGPRIAARPGSRRKYGSRRFNFCRTGFDANRRLRPLVVLLLIDAHNSRTPGLKITVECQVRFRTRLAEGECPRSDRWQYVESFESQDE